MSGITFEGTGGCVTVAIGDQAIVTAINEKGNKVDQLLDSSGSPTKAAIETVCQKVGVDPTQVFTFVNKEIHQRNYPS